MQDLKHWHGVPGLVFYFIVIYLTVLGLHCCTGFPLVVASQGYSPVAVCGLLIAAASLVSEQRL